MSTEIQITKDQDLPPDQQATFTSELAKILPTAGMLEITDDQMKILYEDIPDSAITIRPDGLIYAAWYIYSERLNKAFGGFNWSLVPMRQPEIINDVIYHQWALIVKGTFCGAAIGQCEYQESNKTMSWGDAVEGAKSNALMRILKERGLFNKLWNKTFVEAWKAKYAIVVGTKLVGNQKRDIWGLKPNAFVNGNMPIKSDVKQPESFNPVTSSSVISDAVIIDPIGPAVEKSLVDWQSDLNKIHMSGPVGDEFTKKVSAFMNDNKSNMSADMYKHVRAYAVVLINK